MANPDDTSKPTRSRRNQPKASAASPSSAPPAESTPPSALLTLEEAIENERTVLLQAYAMLHCLYEVLLYADDDDTILHAEVAHTAARLINDSVERLDLVNLRPLIEAFRQSGAGAPLDDEAHPIGQKPYQVREPTPVYLA
jgi:hypothetical protein